MAQWLCHEACGAKAVSNPIQVRLAVAQCPSLMHSAEQQLAHLQRKLFKSL
jgi:hypothetical protein